MTFGLRKAVLGLALAWVIPAYAGTLTIIPSTTIDTFKAEAGGGIPAGIPGWVGGTLMVQTAGDFTFSFLGAGDATNFNEFLISGHCFGTGSTGCGNVGNQPFTVSLPVGAVPFAFI